MTTRHTGGLQNAQRRPADKNTSGYVPRPGSKIVSAHIAQSVEYFLGKEEVTGSNPVMGSTTRQQPVGLFGAHRLFSVCLHPQTENQL